MLELNFALFDLFQNSHQHIFYIFKTKQWPSDLLLDFTENLSAFNTWMVMSSLDHRYVKTIVFWLTFQQIIITTELICRASAHYQFWVDCKLFHTQLDEKFPTTNCPRIIKTISIFPLIILAIMRRYYNYKNNNFRRRTLARFSRPYSVMDLKVFSYEFVTRQSPCMTKIYMSLFGAYIQGSSFVEKRNYMTRAHRKSRLLLKNVSV